MVAFTVHRKPCALDQHFIIRLGIQSLVKSGDKLIIYHALKLCVCYKLPERETPINLVSLKLVNLNVKTGVCVGTHTKLRTALSRCGKMEGVSLKLYKPIHRNLSGSVLELSVLGQI